MTAATPFGLTVLLVTASLTSCSGPLCTSMLDLRWPQTTSSLRNSNLCARVTAENELVVRVGHDGVAELRIHSTAKPLWDREIHCEMGEVTATLDLEGDHPVRWVADRETRCQFWAGSNARSRQIAGQFSAELRPVPGGEGASGELLQITLEFSARIPDP